MHQSDPSARGTVLVFNIFSSARTGLARAQPGNVGAAL
jgi:hypothetical protein